MHEAILTVCLAIGVGTLLVIASQALRAPSIVLLLAGGILLGPEALHWVRPESLGEGLETLVAVLVAIILFEGGITLDVAGYRRAPTVIRRLLGVGPVITWLGTGFAAFALFDIPVDLALIAGSLVIVTGPTVVSPLLRRLNIDERLHHILYWEAVLIDAIGVFVAVLCFEWLSPVHENPLIAPLGRFALRVCTGAGVGAVAGLAMAETLKRRRISNEYVNIFVLACALLTFGCAHAIMTESGILAVVVAGLIVAIRKPRQLSRLQQFKLQLTELAIGTLFILLAAKLKLSQFNDWRLLSLLGVVMFVLRPMSVLLATTGQGFALREKVLLSWIAPRGIIAASMASLFTLRLSRVGFAHADFLETFTYAVIGSTVTLQGLSAPVVARVLGLSSPRRRTWIVAGDKALVRPLALALERAGAKTIQLTELGSRVDALDRDDPRFKDAAGLLCLHGNPHDNLHILARLGEVVPSGRAYTWQNASTSNNESGVFAMGAHPRDVWRVLGNPDEVGRQLQADISSIDVIEVGDEEGVDRFGIGVRPLFFIKDGVAHLVEDPDRPSFGVGDLVVVLRKRIHGLSELLADVIVVDHPSPRFEQVVTALVKRAAVDGSQPITGLVEGIVERERTMPTALGNGISVPHTYASGVQRSRCLVAGVPAGLPDPTPDGIPIRLVFLIISPLGQARTHLQALSAVAELAQDSSLITQLSKQRVPERLRRFIVERA